MARPKSTEVKSKSIFDFLNDIFLKKTPWNDLDRTEQKDFNPYMTGRWISMSMDYLPVINYLQRYTIGLLSSREVYKLYLDLLPKTKFFVKYVKSSKEKDDKMSDNLIEFLCQNKQWSEKEAIENLEIIFKQPDGVEMLIEYIQQYGISEKEIKSKFKLKL